MMLCDNAGLSIFWRVQVRGYVCGHFKTFGKIANLLELPRADRLFLGRSRTMMDMDPSRWSTLPVYHPIGPSCGWLKLLIIAAISQSFWQINIQ